VERLLVAAGGQDSDWAVHGSADGLVFAETAPGSSAPFECVAAEEVPALPAPRKWAAMATAALLQ
jgi:hypothetical protein